MLRVAVVASLTALAAPAHARLGEILEIVQCDVLTNVFKDPIVSPGSRSAHLHTVFGSETFGETVTMADLTMDADSTCDLREDMSMYWMPALMHQGEPLPALLRVYLAHDTKGDLRPFPLGLRAKVQDPRYLEWFCIADKGDGRREEQEAFKGFPGRTTPLGNPCVRWQARQQFPSCWDGDRLDSPDHSSHLAYAVDRACPSTHPVVLPELRFVVTYRLPRDDLTGALALSDSTDHDGTTIHFDFISGWDEGTLADKL